MLLANSHNCYFSAMDIHHSIIIVLSVFISMSTSTTLEREVSITATSPQVCNKTYSCVDCTTARICRPDPNQSGAVTYDVKCTGNTPFCDEKSGSCSRVSSGCSMQQPIKGEFICLRNGKFPHPYSNNKYFECRNYTSFTYNCTGFLNTISYDPEKEECNDQRRFHYLGSCVGYNGLKRTYSSTPFYGYCINDVVALMDKCDGEYEELNETSQKCEPLCLYPGLLQDLTDCRKYYKCNPRNKFVFCARNTYDQTSHTCPDGFGFSKNSFQCVPLHDIPSCKQSTTKIIETFSSE